MAGTKAGYAKTRAKMIERLGSEEAYLAEKRAMGSKGGSNGKGPDYKGGFAGSRELAVRAGAIGGRISRRSKATQQAKVSEYAIPKAYQEA